MSDTEAQLRKRIKELTEQIEELSGRAALRRQAEHVRTLSQPKPKPTDLSDTTP